MSKNYCGQVFEGEVSALSSEGLGIVRREHFIIFIPFTSPGDRILYTITHEKKNFAQGQLLEILQSSPYRTQPFCRYYGTCGGCQLQHIDEETQLKSKRQSIQNALLRIGKFNDVSVLPVNPSSRRRAYRRHITLKIQRVGETLTAGYTGSDHQSFLSVNHCPIFISDENPSIEEVQELLKCFPVDHFTKGKAILFKVKTVMHDKKLILSLHFEKKIKLKKEVIEEIIKGFLKRCSSWIGVIFHHGEVKSSFGETQTFLDINEMRFLCNPDVFTQNHPEQSVKIYQQLVELLSSTKARVLDLYCGIGISSLLLAQQGHEVIGVEYNGESVKLARENGRLNGLTTTKFIQGDVSQVLRDKSKINVNTNYFEVIILNPPRIGVSPSVVDEIVKREPLEIIYISCLPSTLARDLQAFCRADYQIALVQPYDMFPQTYHVETLVHLRKKNGSSKQ